MIQFNLFRFRITVQPFFWLIMALLGLNHAARSENQVMSIAVWVAVVFLSILWHELGHAFVFRRYKVESEIVLHGFGGYAMPLVPPRLTRGQDILVSAAGPAFQLAIGLPLLWLNMTGRLAEFVSDKPYAGMVLGDLLWVNIFWPLFNLLPVYPLDGGRISHALFGPKKENSALWLSFMCALGIALWALTIHAPFMAMLFGMMAWNNWCRITGRPEVPM
jgi:stage IV sporulation protein FB